MNQTACDATRTRQLRLAAHPSAVPWARRLLGQTLREWELDGLADRAELLASELVANAVKASMNGNGAGCEAAHWERIGLTVRLTDTCLVLEVLDASPGLPMRQEPDTPRSAGAGSSSWKS